VQTPFKQDSIIVVIEALGNYLVPSLAQLFEEKHKRTTSST